MPDIEKCLQQFIAGAATTVLKRAKQLVRYIDDAAIVVDKADELAAEMLSSNGIETYETNLVYYNRSGYIGGNCTCPFAEEYDDTCKHQVALAMKWMHRIKTKQHSADNTNKTAGQKNSPKQFDYPFVKISFEQISQYSPGFLYHQGSGMRYHYQTRFQEVKEEKKWKGQFLNKIEVAATYRDASSISLFCTCGKLGEHILCQHTMALLIFISNEVSPLYFYQFNDYTKEKEQLLSAFGLHPQDEPAKGFEFDINQDGQLFIKKQPAYFTGWPAGQLEKNENHVG